MIAMSAQASQPRRGYRGFIEWSNDLIYESYSNISERSLLYTGVSTSHGYQFTPYLFVGAGLSFECCNRYSDGFLPFFIEGRTDLKFGRFTPYGDLRFGYNLANGGGIYISPTVGYRFSWGRKFCINAGVGFTLRGYGIEHYFINIDETGYWQITSKDKTHGYSPCLAFRFGFEF